MTVSTDISQTITINLTVPDVWCVFPSVFHWQATITGPVSLSSNIASGCHERQRGFMVMSLFVWRAQTGTLHPNVALQSAEITGKWETTFSYFRQSRENSNYNKWLL